MKISEMIEGLEELKKEFGDLELVYSSDEEGNYFGKVYFGPTVGNFASYGRSNNGEFIGKDQFEEYEEESLEVNAVCIN